MKLRNLMMAAGLFCLLGTSALAQKEHKTEGKMGAKPTTTKKMPPRDAKGRFIKKDKMKPGDKMTTAKKMPPRDAKGRFIKKDPTKKP